MKFRKKPVVIEAFQFLEAQPMGDAPEWYRKAWTDDDLVAPGKVRKASYGEDGEIVIGTLEGPMFARFGDWIIRGIKGEMYACRDDIFRATYEAVEDDKAEDARKADNAHRDYYTGHVLVLVSGHRVELSGMLGHDEVIRLARERVEAGEASRAVACKVLTTFERRYEAVEVNPATARRDEG